MKTAVDWLYNNLKSHFEHDGDLLEVVQMSFDQAKEMEKNNLYECGSFWRGKENKIEKPFFEQYYNGTFKSE